MTSDLDRETREWLRSATAQEPHLSRARQARLKASVLSKVAAGVALPGAVAAKTSVGGANALGGTSAAAGNSALWSGVLAKSAIIWLVGGAGVGVAVVGTAEWIGRPSGPQRAPSVAARVLPSAIAPPNAMPDASPAAAPTPVASALQPQPSPARAASFATALPRSAVVRAATAAPRAAPLPSGTSDDLRGELDLMNSLQAALRDGATERVDGLIREHAVRFPRGQLHLERMAAEVLAACQRGDRDRAQRAAKRFLALDASSALATRVRASCITEATPSAHANATER